MGKKNYSIREQLDLFGVHDMARELANSAEWCEMGFSPTLAEYYRYAHKVVCDYMDMITKDKGYCDVESMIEGMLYAAYNEYKFYQREHFEHFAELAMVKYQTLNCLQMHIGSKRVVLGIPRLADPEKHKEEDVTSSTSNEP